MNTNKKTRICVAALAVFCVALLYGRIGRGAETAPNAESILARIGVTRGICVLLGDKECKLALDLARNSDLLMLVQLSSADDVKTARRAADRAGLCGTRIFVEKAEPSRIHVADNVADAVVAIAGQDGPAESEVLRALRPGGKAILGEKELIKPFPEGTDDWSHYYHGPDNNPQSQDRLARAPYLTQFIAKPRYAAAPQAAVASGGRLFMAFGHVAWHEREEPSLNTLIAMNGFNGTTLWKRKLTSGIMVDRSTMIATPHTLYLGDEKSCKLIDPATGEVKDEIAPPADLVGGTFWKWMALENGTLYGLVGKAEEADAVARWRRREHGWPWDKISEGYHQAEFKWGAGSTLLAIDPQTKKILWHHKEKWPIDSRTLCMKNGRIYFCFFGQCIVCLDAKTGDEIWRRTSQKDPELFAEIGPFRPGQGFIQGWKTAPYLKCTDKALYFVGPQVTKLVALSAADGSHLWSNPEQDAQVVIRDDGLYAIGRHNRLLSSRFDPLTGKVLGTYRMSRCGCTRSTGNADSIFFRAGDGTVRIDMATGKSLHISPMRPSCHVGLVTAAGHLYWIPWVCDCGLQMFGVISCGPAGDFEFGRKATEEERLEKAGGAIQPAAFNISPNDWPAYRADNVRSARTEAAVPGEVGLLWRFTPKTRFEPTPPVAAGGMVFIGGSDGIVRVFDAATGEERWTAYTGGAILYPPAIADGRALVGSGDGWAYAFEAAAGRRLWRFRAAPTERRIRFYDSLLSTWPVACGVLVEEGVAYFAAGINNYDGTHVYALDAATGEIKWQNNTSGHLDRASRKGVSVQGDILLHDGKLYLAGGNAASVGIYDIADGKCLSKASRGVGSVSDRGRELNLSKDGHVTAGGQPLYSRPEAPVFDRSVKWDDPVVETRNVDLSCLQRTHVKGPGWALVARDRADGADLWTVPLPAEPVR